MSEAAPLDAEDAKRQLAPVKGRPIISFENVSKRFGKAIAVEGVNLEVSEGEFFALLGPSGCGKTTLLRMLAGFENPSEGRILIDGNDVAKLPPNKRPVNMVFQSYAVFPHMNVADNVGYGLRMDGVDAIERDRRVAQAVELVKLEGLEARKPDQLSGGQRQRVALARALVKRPRVLLLDEPLSALDAKLRDQMRSELTQLQEKVGITFIIVTHDQDEALAIATRCAVMNKGSLAQVGAPSELYEAPNSRFVADFVGSVNLFEGVVDDREAKSAVVRCSELEATVYLDEIAPGVTKGATVWVALRPEKIEMRKRFEVSPFKMEDAPQGSNVIPGVIKDIVYLGSETNYEVEMSNGRRVKTFRSNLTRWDQESLTWDDKVWLSWRACSPALLLS